MCIHHPPTGMQCGIVPTATRDVILLQRVQQREQAAFLELYNDYSPALYGIVLRVMNGDARFGQEVLQDVFLKIWNNASAYDPAKGRPFTWMATIARNTAIDRLRSTEMKTTGSYHATDSHVHNFATQATQDQLDNADVMMVIKGLKPEHRELIHMAYYQGFSHREIVERTSIPLGTVKSRTRAALTELRRLLKDHE